MPAPITWTGEQSFRMAGTDRHEDTLKIRSSYAKREHLYRLRLPTLSITYADMTFANAIGGVQKRWPDSAAYGPAFFDPPVVITGRDEVRRLTWIRGAHRVEIGPRETEVEWFSFEGLVVPRLRISQTKPVEALLKVDSVAVDVDPPLDIDMIQYADGRPLGGVRLTKRHPDWKEPEEGSDYQLWVRVVDFVTGRPMAEAKLLLHRWNQRAGRFEPVEEAWTNADGSVHLAPRPSGSLEALTLATPGYRATARMWRAEPNQPVSIRMTASQLKQARYPDGGRRRLPVVYAASYALDPGDTFEWLAEWFRYRSVKELVQMIGSRGLDAGLPIPLPGWFFVHAEKGDSLEQIAELFDIPAKWPRTTGRHHRPGRSAVLAGEVVAVPSHEFVKRRLP